ncbi:MAG: amino acid ABC transporter permease, partial [Bacillota bacterium]
MNLRPSGPALAALGDVRVRRALIQALFLAGVAAFAAFVYVNVRNNLQQLGIPLEFRFLRHPASFAIGESSIPYQPSDSYARAFLAGLVNTLRVAAAGIVLATILGVVAGLARLSANAPLRLVASAYVEVVRNTPLLLQLFFWYGAVFLNLPPPAEAVRLPGPAYLSNRGLVLPAPMPGPGFAVWLAVVLAGVAAGILLYRRRDRMRVEGGRETRPGLAAAGCIAVAAVGGGVSAPAPPLALSEPSVG